jgi:hypothetical protein
MDLTLNSYPGIGLRIDFNLVRELKTFTSKNGSPINTLFAVDSGYLIKRERDSDLE